MSEVTPMFVSRLITSVKAPKAPTLDFFEGCESAAAAAAEDDTEDDDDDDDMLKVASSFANFFTGMGTSPICCLPRLFEG